MLAVKIKKLLPKTPKTWVLTILILIFGGLLAFNILKVIMIKKFFANMKAPAVTIGALDARSESWQTKIETVGELKAVNGVDLSTQILGVVSRIYVQSGQAVGQGQALLDLDDAVDKQTLANYQSQLVLNQASYHRQNELFKQHAISKADFDQATANLKQAEANLNMEQQLIAQKHIVAPFSGRLGIIQVNVGQYVSPGTDLVTLQAVDSLYLDFSLPEQWISKLKIGEILELKVDAYPGKIFKAKVVAISPKVDSNTRNIALRALVPNKDEKLSPGMFAEVQVYIGKPEKLTTVPATAVTISLYGDTIFVLTQEKDQSWVAHERVVQIGETRGNTIVVTKGINPGEKVVTVGQIKLHDGSTAIINNSVKFSDKNETIY